MGDDRTMTKEKEDAEYLQMKSRVDNALIFLRKELIQMRAQDEALLKQLLHIHDTIATLSGNKRSRRQSCGEQWNTVDTSNVLNRSLPERTGLYRRLSAPPDAEHLSDEGVDTDDRSLEEDAFDNQISSETNRDSFGSLDEIDLDLEKEMADFLSPLPPVFLRGNSMRNNIKKIVKIAQNNNTILNGKNNLANKYDISYGELLRRSSKLFKDVQREKRETGYVDQRKMAALKLFL